MKSLIQILNEYRQEYPPEPVYNGENDDENVNFTVLKGQKHTKPYRKFGKGLYKRQ